jgi:Ca2+-binding EF-hand superfamily protein
MADDKKVKKTKKKKEDEGDAAPAAEEKRPSTRESKKAKRSGSNIFSMFSQRQLSEFKEAFQMMDADKDGIIGKSDLRATFDAMGKVANDKEMDEMLGEATGPLNFTMLLTLFGNRMSGEADDDEVIISAFKAFDDNGKIDSEKLRLQLTTFGNKFSTDEVEDAFDQMSIDSHGKIDTAKLIAMLTASAEGEEGEAA